MSKKIQSSSIVPKKIDGFIHEKPFTTRAEWNAYIQKQMRSLRKASKGRAVSLPDSADLTGSLLKRRTEVLLDTIDMVTDRYKELFDGNRNPNVVGRTWVDLNMSFQTYSWIESHSHILFGASIWLADRITEGTGWRIPLYGILPKNDALLDEILFPTVWDCQHDWDLIASIQYILHCRNNDVAPIEVDSVGNDRVITDTVSAERQQHTDTPSRASYEALLALVPEDAKKQAAAHFEEFFWAWSDRFFDCYAQLEKECSDIAAEAEKLSRKFNNTVDEFSAALKEFEKSAAETRKNALQEKRNRKTGPLLVAPFMPELPSVKAAISFASMRNSSIDDFPMDAEMRANPHVKALFAIEKELETYQNCFDETVDRLKEKEKSKYSFLLRLIQQGSISRKDCEESFSPKIADKMNPLPIRDPYELCFALLCLIDRDSDLPWLYGVGNGLMQEVVESLPWGIYEYDEVDDDIWNDEEHPTVRTSTVPDWYERRYRNKGEEFDMPRSLAQILYEETGCIMPRDMHRYDSRDSVLRKYGIRGNAAAMLLSCMSALGNAKHCTKAANFNMSPEQEEAEETSPEASPEALANVILELRKENEELRSALHGAEKATREAKKELESVKGRAEENRRELADLREIVFNRETDIATETEKIANDSMFPYDVTRDTVIFGGHETWEKAIRPLLTGNVRFIGKDLLFDLSVIRHAEIIWIQSNAMSHTQYYRIVDTARLYHKPVRYFSNASAVKCALQIAENEKSRSFDD